MRPSWRLRFIAWFAVVAVALLSADRRGAARRQPETVRPAALAVDFIAVQADGSPVTDLRPSDVEVRLNGRVRTVRSLRRVTATGQPPGETRPGSRLPPPFATNEIVAAGRDLVLLVDEQSFLAGSESLLRNAVEGLLPHLGPADRTMVVALPYGAIKAPFTSDHAIIRNAMAGIVAQGMRGESGTDMAVRTRTFLEYLEAFLRAQAGRGNPLTVVAFTAGLAGPRRDAPMTMMPGRGEVVINDFKRITVAAGAARANFYLMQPADIVTNAAAWRETIAGSGYLGSDNPLEGIEHLAGATGAVRLPLEASGTASLVRVGRETSAYYVADLEAVPNELFGRSRPLAVRVARAGVIVRTRPEITFRDAGRPGRAARIDDLLASGDTTADLRLRAAGFTVREADGRLRVGVVVEPVDPRATLAAAGALLVEPGGRIAARWIARDTAARPLLGALAAQPGAYRLRVAAIDVAGRTGVVEELVEARLARVGPLSLGSLMLGVSRDAGTTPQLQFGAEPAAVASFDIYGGAAGMALSATLDLARDLDGPALAGLPLAFARSDESRVVATATVPIGALAPGDYVVRAVIRLEDGASARITRTLRKSASQGAEKPEREKWPLGIDN